MAQARHRSSFSYTLDSDGRLVAARRGARQAGLEPVQTVAGSVTTDAQNRLAYDIEQPLQAGTPSRVVFDGAWRLTPEHRLVFAARRRGGAQPGAAVSATLTRAGARTLTAAIERRGQAPAELTLTGAWQVDAQNRLTFLVDRGGRAERLTLRGAWRVGPDHELAYEYRHALEGRRGHSVRMLRFDGAWSLGRAGRLRYALEGSDDAALELRGSFEPGPVDAVDGRLAFRLGAAVSRTRSDQGRLVLSGGWKIGRDRSVSFDIPAAGGRRGTLRFAASASGGSGQTFDVELAAPQGARLRIAVRFSRRLFRDTRLFLQASRDGRESAVLGGVQLDF